VLLLSGPLPVFPQNISFTKVTPPKESPFVFTTSITQDTLGYMWFASGRVLYRYNGYEFTIYKNNPSNPNSLAGESLISVFADKSGFIWVGGFRQGLNKLDPQTGIFTHYPHSNNDASSISSDTIYTITEDHEGYLWIGTSRGLNLLDKKTGKFIRYKHDPDDPASLSEDDVRIVYEDRSGIIWVGTGGVFHADNPSGKQGGLNRLDRKTGKFVRYLNEPNNPHSLIDNRVTAICEDRSGIFWVGTAGDGLHTMDRATGKFERHLYDPAHPEKLSRPPQKKIVNEADDHITFIKEDVTGAIWIGTFEGGLNRYDPKTRLVSHYEAKSDADTSHRIGAWEMYSSREGVIWISTWDGLYNTDPFRWNIPHYASPGAYVESFLEETSILWIGTGAGLFRKDVTTGNIKRYTHDPLNPASVGNNFIQYIFKDRQGNIWLGTHGGLDLLNKDNETFTHYPNDPKNSSSLSSQDVNFIYEDAQAKLWIATTWGLNSMDRKTGAFTSYFFHPKDTFPGKNNITYILKDRQEKLWVGSWAGLYVLNPQNGKFKDYLEYKSILGLCEDAQGDLWVGTNDGLYLYNRMSDAFTRFVDVSSSTDITEVKSMVEDNQRNLWICFTHGLIKLNTQRHESSTYGTYYGVNVNNLVLTYCHKGPQGKLYFGDETGYFAFLPDQLGKNAKPLEIVITSLRLTDQVAKSGKQAPITESLLGANKIQLHYDQNIFSFEFAAFDYSNPQGNRDLYMLENYDDTWREAGSEQRAYYFNVPPGKYTFRVKADNSNGIWTEKFIAVIITPPWWGTWWFRITAIFCAAAIFYGIIRWRIYQKFRSQLERSEKEKQLADLRHKTVELEMQALRAQMNPHFIFNCLSSINGFILKNESEPASDYLTKFSRLIRMVLTNSKKPFITLEDELEMLRLYLEMERLRFQYSFNYNISFKNEIDPENIFIPPVLLQPFAENAIWHGLMHKQGEGHLEILLSLKKKILTCIITDNGIGRNKAAMIKSKSAEKQKSMGLQITKERLALLNQDIEAQTSFNIEDITDDKGNAAGTRVILKMHCRDLTETIA